VRRWLPALLVFGACAPFASDPTSAVEPANDASADTSTDSVVPLAPADAAPRDASGIVLAKPFCLGLPIGTVICEDFENTDLEPSWDETPPGSYFAHFFDPVTHGGAARYDIETKTADWLTSGHVREHFERDLSLNPNDRNTVEISLDLYLDVVPTDMDLEVAALNVGPIVGGPYNVHVNFGRPAGTDANAANLEVGQYSSGSDVKTTVANISMHAWHRIFLSLASGGAQPSSYQMTVDGSSAANGAIGAGQGYTTVNAVTATAGLTYLESLSGTMIYFVDNILIAQHRLL
jgi:hypothetical protein